MEYVEGEPLTKYSDTRRLNTVDRLKLFQQVCAAVQYAHQNLVVHRDIKPSNILVASDGTPKLLDFGIAKLVTTDRASDVTDQTATSLRLMTPEYASPEQLRGLPITTASDVYSLGVVLYELLTGHRPFSFNSRMPDEIARVLLTEEPIKPSSAATLADSIETDRADDVETRKEVEANRDTKPKIRIQRSRLRSISDRAIHNPKSLRGDLDNIILKALRKDPDRRYQSVQELSTDIRRHLEGLPVTARADTLGYRAGKFVRRHRAGVLAATVAVIALIAGTSIATWEAHIARSERDRAETRFNQVRKLANSIVFDYHDQIQKLPGSTPVREKMIKDAIEYLDNLSVESHNDPTLQRELAAAYEKVGDVQGNPYFENLGDVPGALASYRKALEIREELFKKNPTDALTKHELGNGYKNIGDILWNNGENDESLSQYQKALAIFTELSNEDQSNLRYQSRMSAVLNGIGHVQEQAGDWQGALDSYRKMLAYDEVLVSSEPANDEYRRSVAVGNLKVGDAMADTGDHLHGLEYYQRGVVILSGLTSSDKNNASALRLLALAYGRTAGTHGVLKQYQEAVESFRKTIELQNQISAADPQNIQIRFDLATSYQNLGDNLRELKKLDAAASNVLEAIRIFDEAFKRNAGQTQARGLLGAAYQTLGEIFTAKGETQAAFENFKKALSILEAEPVRSGRLGDLAACYEDVGDLQSSMREWKAARESYQKSVALFLDLERSGRLSASDKNAPSELSQKIAKCDSALVIRH
jgi:non-specific serine/threonine protein kinase/serine/threonine-protein kinase